MVKTTIYLPDGLKAALEREAKRSNTSEAELVRLALERLLSPPALPPRPRFGRYEGEPLTLEQMDDELARGFGHHDRL